MIGFTWGICLTFVKHEIIGTRHHIVHDYLNVDYDIVWSITTNELKQLYADLKSIIPPELE